MGSDDEAAGRKGQRTKPPATGTASIPVAGVIWTRPHKQQAHERKA